MKSIQIPVSVFVPAALVLLAAGTAFTAPQKRASDNKPKDFPALLQSAGEDFKKEAWGETLKSLSKAQGIVMNRRHADVVASFPEMGEGWKMTSEKPDAAASAMLAGMAGFMVEGKYTGPDRKSATLQTMIDSPMASMMGMGFAAAGRDPKVELIEYEKYKAMLTNQGSDRYQLMIMIDSSVVQLESRGLTDDEVLAMMSEAAVTKIAAAIQK